MTKILSQEEEELLHGVKKPSERGGRLPLFFRAEVDEIRADDRPMAQIAETWEVSYDTIMRVKQSGRFRHCVYIPRDEVDRSIPYSERECMKDQPTDPNNKDFHAYKSGRRDKLTSQERLDISLDKRVDTIIAADYEISVSTVRSIRRKFGRIKRNGFYSRETIEMVKRETRTHEEIGRLFGMPVATVKAIKSGEFDG